MTYATREVAVPDGRLTVGECKATMLPGTDHAASVMTPSSGAAIAAEIDALVRVAV